MNDETEEDERSLREIVAMFNDLQQHAGWKRLQEILEEQVNSRIQTLLSISEDQRSQDFTRGEINGIRTVMRYPQLCIESAQVDIDIRKEG